MGYYIGYEIAKSYYDRAPEKRQAIAMLIRMEDPAAILRESHYAD